MKIYLIDANNVLHKIAQCKNKMKSDYAAACLSFLNILKTFSARYPAYKIIAFFDGYSESVFINHPAISIQWSFSKTADELIKAHIRLDYDTKNYTLVSSDTELHNFSRIHALEIISSDNFILQLNSASSTSNKSNSYSSNTKAEKPNSAGRKEVALMLELFKSAKN